MIQTKELADLIKQVKPLLMVITFGVELKHKKHELIVFDLV